MEMTVWRVTTRHLAPVPSERSHYSFLIATTGTTEKDAVQLAKDQYSEAWWKENLLQEVEEIGRLKAAEGLKVPGDEID